MLETEVRATIELAAEHGLSAEEYARVLKILDGHFPLLLVGGGETLLEGCLRIRRERSRLRDRRRRSDRQREHQCEPGDLPS